MTVRPTAYARSRCERALRYLFGLLLAAIVGLAAGCEQVTVEQSQATGQTLCRLDYETCVDPIFHSVISGRTGPVTCSASGCHDNVSGSGGGLKLVPNPGTPADLQANFLRARTFGNLNAPDQSKLLLEPLTGQSAISGTHTGGDIFPGTNDACYRVVRDWIALAVDSEDSTSCGVCVPVNVAQCGF